MHHVGGVFLQRVIDARFEIRLRAVVIDAQAAADIEILQPRPALHQVGIGPAGFGHRRLHVADVRDLAAEVKMQQLEAIEHVAALQLLDRVQNFARPSGRTCSASRPTTASARCRGRPA